MCRLVPVPDSVPEYKVSTLYPCPSTVPNYWYGHLQNVVFTLVPVRHRAPVQCPGTKCERYVRSLDNDLPVFTRTYKRQQEHGKCNRQWKPPPSRPEPGQTGECQGYGGFVPWGWGIGRTFLLLVPVSTSGCRFQ